MIRQHDGSLRSYPYSYRAMASEWSQHTMPPHFGNPAFLYPVEFPRDTTGGGTAAAPSAAGGGATVEPPHIYEEVGPPDPPRTLPPSFRSWLPASAGRGSLDFEAGAADQWAGPPSSPPPLPISGPPVASGDILTEQHVCRGSSGHCVSARWTMLNGAQAGSLCCCQHVPEEVLQRELQRQQYWQQQPQTSLDVRAHNLSPSASNSTGFATYPSLPTYPTGHGCSCSLTGTLPCCPAAAAATQGQPARSLSAAGFCPQSRLSSCAAAEACGCSGSTRGGGGSACRSAPASAAAPAAGSVNCGSASSSGRKKRGGFRSLSPFTLFGKGSSGGSRNSTNSILHSSGCRSEDGSGGGCAKIGNIVVQRPCVIIFSVMLVVTCVVALTVGLGLALTAKSTPYEPRKVWGSLQILGGRCSTYDKLLGVPSSARFVNCAGNFTEQLDSMYRRSNASGFYNYSEVLRFRPGSVVVEFRLHLRQQSSVATADGTSYVHWLAAVLKSAAGGADKAFVSMYAVNVSSIVLQFEDSSAAEGSHTASLADPRSETLATETWPGMLSSTQKPSQPPYVIPQQSGVCTTITNQFCQKMPWNVSGTTAPNFVGLSQNASESQLLVLSLLAQRCYNYFDLFVCSVYVPKCGRDGMRLPPCRRLCQDALAGCGAWMEAIHTTVPVDCNLFPDSSDPNVCVDKDVPASKCPIGKFQCDSGMCVQPRSRCDGVSDCVDHSDEAQCDNYKCTTEQFKCRNSSCRPLLWVCDGRDDCGDNSDEEGCIPDGPCEANKFHCKQNGTSVWDPTTSCILSSYICDGTRDCSDGTDEDPQRCRDYWLVHGSPPGR